MNNLLSPTSTPGRNFKNTISVLDEYRVEYGMSEVSEVRYVPEAEFGTTVFNIVKEQVRSVRALLEGIRL